MERPEPDVVAAEAEAAERRSRDAAVANAKRAFTA
jgi:hypothetical protein